MIWETVLIGVHFLIAVALIGFILMQHGKGADMGAAFGSGASGSLFGAAGSANFLSRTTAVLAALFFILSLALAYVATRRPAEQGGGVIDAIRAKQTQPVKPEEKKDVEKPAADVPKPPAPTDERKVPQ